MKMEANRNSLKISLLYIIAKIVIIIILLGIIYYCLFGVYRCNNDMMNPAFKDGDLVIYYRLQKEYQSGDTVVIEKNGEMQVVRVIAQAGDKVDIDEDGLKINGYLQQEKNIYVETLPYVGQTIFPVSVKEKEYFVLCDNRINAKDSRVYGGVKKDEIKGLVITLLRPRGF